MNNLNHFQEFADILKNYEMSEHAKSVLQSLRIVLLIGPTSAGRNTIIRRLVTTGDYLHILSDTTRQKRMNDGVLEQHGVEYWFRTEEEVLEDLRNGEFLEAAIIHNQQVSGMSIRELERISAANKIAINEVQIDGADNVHKAKPDARIFFVLPPDFPAWMQRINKRGTLPKEEVRRRLESAREEFQHALDHDYYEFLINRELVESVVVLDRAIKTRERDEKRDSEGRKLAETLLRDTNAFLAKL